MKYPKLMRYPRLGSVFFALGFLLTACAYQTNYAPKTTAQAAAEAEALLLDPAPALSKSSSWQVILSDAEKLNHKTAVLGIHCSGNSYFNSLQKPVERYLAAFDANGKLGDAATDHLVVLTVNSASSSVRCFLIGSVKIRCIAKVDMSFSSRVLQDSSERILPPLFISLEEVGKGSIWTCGALKNIVQIVSERASGELVDQLKAGIDSLE